MKTRTAIGLIVLAAMLLSSCSMEKRLYMPGYYVEWNKKQASVPLAQKAAASQMVPQKEIRLTGKVDLDRQIIPARPQEIVHQQPAIALQDQKPLIIAANKLSVKKNTEGKHFSSSTDRQSNSAAEPSTFVLILLILLFAPAAVAVKEGKVGGHFWLCLLFTILGVLPGIIYASVLCFSNT